MEQDNNLEKAFQKALKLSDDLNDDASDDGQFDDGVQKVLPQLFDNTFSQESVDYVGAVFNQYQIIKQIGAGGMGNVYLAKRIDGQFDKTVAIKVLTKGFNNQTIKDRFLREKQILAQLRHPNIVPLLDAGTTDDGIPWFVLEYIQGKNIDEFCQSNNLSTEAIVNLAIKICDAIQFAHSKAVIHRDIKPANILVENIDGDFNPIILDFGIAHSNDQQQLTHQGHLVGTPGYMSPEQIKGDKNIDRRTDIFSIGVVLYQLFSDTKPFKAPSAIETHQKIIHCNPEKLTKIIASFPKDLQIITETCLNKNANDRYQSVLNLQTDLQNWLNGYPILAKKQATIISLWKAIKRNKTTAILISSVFLVGLIAIAKYTYDINQERQIAIQANTESEDLFNFLLKDLHKELKILGRVDLLESVAEKNLQHLNKYNLSNHLSDSDKLKYVTSYRNIANVLEMQQDTTPSLNAYIKAKDILLEIENSDFLQQKSTLLALTYTDLAGLHAKLGQLELANDEHEKARHHAQILTDMHATNATEILWEVIHPLSWNLMEQSLYQKSKIYLDQALNIANTELKNNTTDHQWLSKKFKSQVALGWYYIDLREIDSSIKQYSQAMVSAEKLLEWSPHSVPLINNLQKTNNQIAYAYVLNKDYKNAISRAKKAITYGKLLYQRAPENHIYYRALSYSYTMLGNAYNNEKRLDLAEINFKASLDITKQIASSAPESSSLQNDLAVDMLNFADLLGKKGDPQGEKQYWEIAEKILENIATQVNASIYYVDTYVYVLLIQGKIKKATPYLLRMKNTQGWPNESYNKLVEEYKLSISDDNGESSGG